jgi:hypothetical protein
MKDIELTEPSALWTEAYAGIPDEESLELTEELKRFLQLLKGWHMEAPKSDPQTLWNRRCQTLPTSKEVLSILRLFPTGPGLAGKRAATYCSAPAHDRQLLAEHQRGLRRACAAVSVDAPHHLHDTYGRGQQDRPGWSYLWQLAEARQIDAIVMLTLDHVPGPDNEWIVATRLLEESSVRLYVVDDLVGCLALVPSPETALQWLAVGGAVDA